MKAILTNNVTGERVKVHATTNHPSSSYGIPVWVDDTNTAYLQVGVETFQSFYSISDVDDMVEWQKYAPKPIVTKQDIRQRIGARIRDLRTHQHLSQQQLADMAGVTKANICNIERGAYSVGLDILNKIATALNSSIQIINNSNDSNIMKTITNLSKNIRTVEHSYVANNHRCLDYAVLFTHNHEERFCGYIRSNNLDAIVGETADYSDIIRRWEQNAEMPEWVKEAIG